jgi:lysophospholipase L1-like esterase
MDKYDMQNLGMNSNYGGTTTEMLTYSPAIDALYAASRKNIIVVLEGLNDWGSGVTSDKAYQNLADYCKARKDKGYKVVIVTLIGVAGEQPFPVADFEKHQQFVNTAIRKNWQNYADAIADVATDPNIGTNRAELTEYYQSDGRHLSPKGAEIIAQIVKNAVIKL